MPDFSRSRKPPRLGCRPHPHPSPTEREANRRLFAEWLTGLARVNRKTAVVSETAPSGSLLLRALQSGKRRVADDCEISVRGMTRDGARRSLATFFEANRRRGIRFVKVIHGKGQQSPGGQGVLRREVPVWLGEWKGNLVERWSEARRDDGGPGALYVILPAASRMRVRGSVS